MGSMELLINLIIIGLLIPTIIYAYRLNKNLSLLRQNQNSLAKLIQSLNEATIKAEHSIPKLKTATESTSGELKEVVDNAKLLKDDLMFINERADNLADRIENVIHDGRQVQNSINTPRSTSASGSDTAPSANTPYQTSAADRSEAELELLKALRAIK